MVVALPLRNVVARNVRYVKLKRCLQVRIFNTNLFKRTALLLFCVKSILISYLHTQMQQCFLRLSSDIKKMIICLFFKAHTLVLCAHRKMSFVVEFAFGVKGIVRVTRVEQSLSSANVEHLPLPCIC